jgi:hypothetical protein
LPESAFLTLLSRGRRGAMTRRNHQALRSETA